MSIFQFKVSSLSKVKDNKKNQASEIDKVPVTSNPSRLFGKSNHSHDSDNPSQFFIDEKELWDDENEKDMFELDEGEKQVEKPLSCVSPEKINGNFSDDCIIVDNSEIVDKKSGSGDVENSEEVKKVDEVNFELTDYSFEIPSDEETNFDLGGENDDELKLDEARLENSISPTFDVSYKSGSKKSSTGNETKNSSPEGSPKLENSKTNVRENNLECLGFLEGKLNPLGITAETDTWLEEILENEAFFNVTLDTPEQKLQNNMAFLNKSYVEILEKVAAAFESLPIKMLEMFPGFDQDVFMSLRTTRRKIKAVMIKTENLLKRKNMAQALTDNKISAPSGVIHTKQENSHKDFSNLMYTNDFNQSPEEKCVNKSLEGVFMCKQPSKLVRKSVTELTQTRPNFPVVSTSKENTCSFNVQAKNSSSVVNFLSSSTPKNSILGAQKTEASPLSSMIDYTDALYNPSQKHSNGGTSGRFHNQHRNDGASGEFNGLNFPHSKELLEKLHQKFGLRSFRTNQLQVINAALLGLDCFVLMPTGGGKSLCYQLPAIMSKGVTLVISPLRSLILDQVTKLLMLDIAAAHLSGDIKDSEASLIYRKLNQPEPSIKLLYVTPEKVTGSASLRNCLSGLYKRNMLARFVIDEVHCVSQWGHDFRPDYKKLRELRENYPKVNIMALTATATPRVRVDILHELKMSDPKWFLSSFNRSNLTYRVKDKKGKSTLKEIATLIQNEFKNNSGIIYCFSRKECEDVAKDLKNYGITAIPYHGGLNDNERTRAQNLWMNDKVKVVCATIAFGMGIDKLDVRFVIHYSLPKSIEGYYQESGRAGRDGEKASCILFYSYRDKIRMLKLIAMDQGMSNEAAKRVHINNLFRLVAFAENKTDCRRALQLAYFGEKFDRKSCVENRDTTCDNCLHGGTYECVDVTAESKAIVSSVKQVCESAGQRQSNFTMLHFVDIFKGATVKKVLAKGHNNLPAYSMGKSWDRLDVERLIGKLVMEEFLKERLMVKDDITFAYLQFGRRGEELLKGNIKIKFEVKKRKGSLAAQSTVKSEQRVDPALFQIQEKCHADLMSVIHDIASSINCNPNAIMNVQALRAMSFSLPETPEEMLSINHVTTANFEKYGSVLLEVTKKYAAEKKALQDKEAPEEDVFADEFGSANKSEDSPYFETNITFIGKKRKNNFRKSQNAKKWKGGSGSGRASSSKRKTGPAKSNAKSSGSSSGGTTVSGAKFCTLMELPTNKATGFPRPKVFLKNL